MELEKTAEALQVFQGSQLEAQSTQVGADPTKIGISKGERICQPLQAIGPDCLYPQYVLLPIANNGVLVCSLVPNSPLVQPALSGPVTAPQGTLISLGPVAATQGMLGPNGLVAAPQGTLISLEPVVAPQGTLISHGRVVSPHGTLGPNQPMAAHQGTLVSCGPVVVPQETLGSNGPVPAPQRMLVSHGPVAAPPQKLVSHRRLVMPKLTFDDVAVMFSKDEWILLDGEQQQLYQDVMLENYWNLLSVGFKIRKPDLICLMEEGTKLWVPDMYDSKAVKPEQDPRPPTTGLPPYTCAACLKSFRSRWSLRRHEGVHTGVKPFQCLSCGCCFSQAYRLQRHRALREGLAKPHDCPCCTRRFWCRMGLSQHLRSHAGQQPNACLVCTKLSRPGHANLEDEGRTAVGDSFPEGAHDTGGCSRTFCMGQLPVAGKPQGPVMLQTGILSHSCFQCGKSFSSCRLLARHCLSVHTAPAERLHQGLVCGKRFVFSWKLQEHVDTHDHRLKLHPCPECGKRFFGQSKVRRHQMVHAGEKPYPCPRCDRRFCQKSYVAVHVKMAHGAGKVRAPLRSWHSGAGRSRAKASEERSPRLPEAARSQAITAADVKSTFAV